MVIATVNATRPKLNSHGEKDGFRRLFRGCESVVIATLLSGQLFRNGPIGNACDSTASIKALHV